MNTYSIAKLPAIIALSCVVAACSNNPKVVEPTLGAASVEPVSTAPEIVATPRGPSLTLDNVLFGFEQSNLRPEATDTISKAVSYLNANPQRNALVEGHTDHTGAESFNHNLSVQRSESVRAALMQQGIDKSRIITVGLGESKPIADNASLSGRKANRRVEIIFEKSNSSFE